MDSEESAKTQLITELFRVRHLNSVLRTLKAQLEQSENKIRGLLETARTYDHGVNSYIVKPVTFESLVQVMRALSQYWLETVELPLNGAKG